jgi:hypothetical protein
MLTCKRCAELAEEVFTLQAEYAQLATGLYAKRKLRVVGVLRWFVTRVLRMRELRISDANQSFLAYTWDRG